MFSVKSMCNVHIEKIFFDDSVSVPLWKLCPVGFFFFCPQWCFMVYEDGVGRITILMFPLYKLHTNFVSLPVPRRSLALPRRSLALPRRSYSWIFICVPRSCSYIVRSWLFLHICVPGMVVAIRAVRAVFRIVLFFCCSYIIVFLAVLTYLCCWFCCGNVNPSVPMRYLTTAQLCSILL